MHQPKLLDLTGYNASTYTHETTEVAMSSSQKIPSQKFPIDYVQTNEQKRLNDARESGIPWKKWGPYLSERQWGTVREDYSQDGNAWDYFSHDQARSRTYRWGEDGCPQASRKSIGTRPVGEQPEPGKVRLFAAARSVTAMMY